MEYFRNVDVVNVNAMPLVSLQEPLVIKSSSTESGKEVKREDLKVHSPSCIVGSISQVNQKIAVVNLRPNQFDNILAIEEYELELEKNALRKKSRGPTEDRAKSLGKIRLTGRFSEVRNARRSLFSKKKIFFASDKNLLAELYEEPPFDSSKPNDLPNGLSIFELIDNVIQAEKNPITGMIFCSERELQKFLSSPCVSDIWLDSFWWLFHERYQPNLEVQNKLFDRISQNYAFLLFNGPKSHYEEAIIKNLPSLLSKAMYTTFCCCFPQSWFNTHEFKSEICNTMTVWFSGIYPVPQSYRNWNYSKLDPERSRREELLQQSRLEKGRESFLIGNRNYFQKGFDIWKNSSVLDQDFCQRKGELMDWRDVRVLKDLSQQNYTSICLDASHKDSSGDKDLVATNLEDNTPAKTAPKETLVLRKATEKVKKITEARIYEQTYKKMSHPARKSRELTFNLFNIYGTSPLIMYFLQHYTTLEKHGEDVLITRREEIDTSPMPMVTYSDLIKLIMSRLKRQKEKMEKLRKFHCQEWTYFDSYLKYLQDNCTREMRFIDQAFADKRKANQTFLPSSSLFEEFADKKCKKSCTKDFFSPKI